MARKRTFNTCAKDLKDVTYKKHIYNLYRSKNNNDYGFSKPL
jgi:hypothetical protein